jgi:hypothetical protein
VSLATTGIRNSRATQAEDDLGVFWLVDLLRSPRRRTKDRRYGRDVLSWQSRNSLTTTRPARVSPDSAGQHSSRMRAIFGWLDGRMMRQAVDEADAHEAFVMMPSAQALPTDAAR